MPTIRFIRPSSMEPREHALGDRLPLFQKAGLIVKWDEPQGNSAWPYTAQGKADRLKTVTSALTETGIDYVWCVRGGYGLSEILSDLPWKKLADQPWRCLVGFSDATALSSALYAQLGWPSLHAPMPATALWHDDQHLHSLLGLIKEKKFTGAVPLDPLSHARLKEATNGKLFGGCMSVLTNLIGTKFFPSLKGHIVFLEDTDENPGRVMRYLQQWIDSGALEGVMAIVLGQFRNAVKSEDLLKPHLYKVFAERVQIPVYASDAFGHCWPNLPLMVGATAHIYMDELRWELNDRTS